MCVRRVRTRLKATHPRPSAHREDVGVVERGPVAQIGIKKGQDVGDGAQRSGTARRLLASIIVVLLAALTPFTVSSAEAAPVAQKAARHGKPSAPGLAYVEGGADSLALYYTPPSSDGGHKIRYYQATVNGGKTWKKIGRELDADGYLTGYRRHLKVGKHYKVAVRAVNSRGHSKSSDVHKIIAVNSPSVPRDVRVSVEGTTITVTWKKPKTDGGSPITAYIALANADGGLDFSCPQPTPPTARSCQMTGVTPGTTYLVTLLADNHVEQPADASPMIVGTGWNVTTEPIPVVVP